MYTHLDDGKIVEEARGIMMFPEFNIQADTKDMVFQRYKEQKFMVFSSIISVENERSGNTYIKILDHVYMPRHGQDTLRMVKCFKRAAL